MMAAVSVDKAILYPALRKAGVTLGPGRTPAPAQYADAIAELNRLAGSWNCDPLVIYGLSIELFPITAGKKTYTIGKDPTGATIADFDVQRPQGISQANVIRSGAGAPLRYPLVLATPQIWAGIQMQDLANTIPQVLYNDYAYPISTLYLWGQPMASMQLELYVWNVIPQFQTITDLVILPPGYEDALVLNLACRLAPQFQRDVSPDVRQQARESLMRLESLNAPKPIADTGSGCKSGYMNVYSGQIY